MHKILTLSGANELLMAAVWNQQCYYRTYQKGLAHNENIVALCAELLMEAKLKKQDLTAIAVDLGPGSFTGQRISLSFAKGLSFALGKPLLGFNTFSVWLNLHYNIRQKNVQPTHLNQGDSNNSTNPVLVLIDGRKRRFYGRLFSIDKNILATWDLSSQALCQKLLDQYGTNFLIGLQITGPGAPMFWQELKTSEGIPGAAAGSSIPLSPNQNSGFSLPNEAALAQTMLELAQQEYQAQRFMKASAGPLYLRKSDAEERLSKK